MKKPFIFDIKRYSINDGPGIRTTVFIKGCPLRCSWCHNPESQVPEKQKLYTASKCIGALDCIEVCPNRALEMTREGIVTNNELCELCGKCAEACPSKAIEMSGREYAREEILEILERERVHYDHSGGGVTFSGGEPLMFPEYLVELLEECGRHKIHRTVDTCGFAPAKTILEVAKHTDLFLYDLKQMNDNIHRKFTGVSNKPIIRNLQLLSETGAEINIRIPLIKNINSDPGSITAFAQFILKLQGKKPVVNLLPYHRIASGKYLKLGKIFDEGEMTEPSIDEQQKAVQIFRDLGLDVEIGG